MRRQAWAAAFVACFMGPMAAADDTWPPVVVDWTCQEPSLADVSFLLPTPAGKDGPIRVKDGHLTYPDGRRFRVWGVNATGAATVPTKEHAAILAKRLAQHGINCVRFHFLDRKSPDGLLATGAGNGRSLDPGQLDRFDFFVAELKKLGIYSNINLNVGRTYDAGDGVKDHELIGFAKALTYFDPRLIELQMEYARQLLTHRNAYTDCEYRHEPAVATVELLNENSLVESWFSGRLLGKNTTKRPGTWTDIPESYEKDLTALYNRWLKDAVNADDLATIRKEAGAGEDGIVARLVPGDFNKASKLRFHTEARFYMEIERKFMEDMSRLLKDELGVRAPLVGTSDHNHGRSGYPLLCATSALDIVDGHVYWQHPRYITGANGRRGGFDITNSPMVDDPLHSTVVQLSRSAMAGKPYTVSEVGHPFPNEYACEGIPILAAYGALHDWDGIYWYTLGHRDIVGAGPSSISHFDLYPDPVKMTQIAAGALMFLRPDVRPARQTLQRGYSREQVVESLRLPWKDSPYFTPGFPLAAPLRSAIRLTSLDGQESSIHHEQDSNPIRSDTEELLWHRSDKGSGLVVIDTPRSQALVGYLAADKETANLKASMETPFCAVTLSALDEQPISSSSRLLLTCAARAANTGMVWTTNRKSLDNWGTAPTRIEPVRGNVLLKNLGAARQLSAQPLNGSGRPLDAPISASNSADGWTIPIGKVPCVAVVVTVVREEGGVTGNW